MQINNEKIALSPGEHRKVMRGDILLIADLVTRPADDKQFKVNFKGFVGNKRYNDGGDRGYRIDTAEDLWLKYSKDRKGKIYTIETSVNEKVLASFYIDIQDPPAK